ncbi:hypothetical protein KN815_21330 [Streptomyces sp. 4503]|uniref:Uncharacterized protein n=1 Tax=Streptomyces niphimycinicus TaxID=2842201 RepID=A0ABS6CHV8_9ACTN|nr:hypothetical protein [Streptomyces niphimycinicus]MBU3866512.1 hypothetical protein [Streptomyces niphimycinicus]
MGGPPAQAACRIAVVVLHDNLPQGLGLRAGPVTLSVLVEALQQAAGVVSGRENSLQPKKGEQPHPP